MAIMTKISATQDRSVQAIDTDAIRPFRVNCPEAEPYRIAQAYKRD